MSTVHVRHVRVTLERLFAGLVDLSDYEGRGDEERSNVFLSRALAAYAVHHFAEVELGTAANSLVDGFEDNGIDGIYHDEGTRTLWLVQSKWNRGGRGCPSVGDVKKFVDGVRDLVNCHFSRFNKKVQARKDEIRLALEDVHVRIHLVLAYPGTPLATLPMRDIDDLLMELNNPSEVARFIPFTLAEIHRAVSGQAQERTINFEIALLEWGQVREPHLGFYGQANAADIARLWQEHGQQLFTKDIRKFLGDNTVNESVQSTLKGRPEDFWYFNNGITILSSKVQKKALGGSTREMGIFVCEGASVVNGAQTVGNIGQAYITHPCEVESARVLTRVISLERCPAYYANELTRATNTQTRIEKRDFVSLDPQQERLRTELQIELGRRYVYKTGDTNVSPEEECNLEEATAALACSSGELQLAIWSKKEIGRLWEDIRQPPYTTLFNERLTGVKLWRVVQVMRAIDKALKVIQGEATGVPRNIAVHGNRFIAFQVFQRLSAPDLENPGEPIELIHDETADLTHDMFEATYAAVGTLYPDALIGRLFYNAAKCREISSLILINYGASKVS